jgi:N-acyl-D-aspartate/D-glutamate deacylase
MFDIVIRSGTVVDGLGSASRTEDVAIQDGHIVEMGAVKGPARRVIDADGALVTPGWVDAHTHYDGQVTWDDQLEGSAANGVTSVIMGNCGVGFAPVPPGGAEALIDLMEGVEDIPGTALFEGMPWGRWETFPEYLSLLDERRYALDVGAQIAHGALRFYVMGERAISREAATGEEVARMAAIAEEAVRAGAVGFSTSRIMGHRSISGYNVPGTFAADDELAAIAGALRAGGGAVFQAIPSGAIGELGGVEPEHSALLDEVGKLGGLSRAHALPVVFSTFQHATDPTVWRSVLDRAAAENARGARLAPMVAPRAASALTSLSGYHLFMRRPTYLRLAGQPFAQLVKALRQPEIKAAILSEHDAPHPQPGAMENVLPGLFDQALDRTFPLSDPLDYEPPIDQSLAELARRQGRDPHEFVYDFLLEDDGAAVAAFFGLNYVDGNLDACRAMLLDPNTVTGLSDAGAHVNFVCDMSIPTFNLTHWVRDRSRGERLPLELMVAKATAAPARLYGLNDRGALKVGLRADVNVIDLAALEIQRPVMRKDLPAGGTRYLQPSTGYLATLVRGQVTRENDRDTGARPGRVARPSAAAASSPRRAPALV